MTPVEPSIISGNRNKLVGPQKYSFGETPHIIPLLCGFELILPNTGLQLFLIDGSSSGNSSIPNGFGILVIS